MTTDWTLSHCQDVGDEKARFEEVNPSTVVSILDDQLSSMQSLQLCFASLKDGTWNPKGADCVTVVKHCKGWNGELGT